MLSIKTQKVLMFIPFVNMINVFMWIIAVITRSTNLKRFVITVLKCFGLMIVITIPRIIIYYFVDSAIVQKIESICSTYLYFFIFSYFAVKAQIQIEKERENNG